MEFEIVFKFAEAFVAFAFLIAFRARGVTTATKAVIIAKVINNSISEKPFLNLLMIVPPT